MAQAEIFGPADIARATDGRITATDLRNWIRDGRFNTPIPEAKAGKPRGFPLPAVYEAALLSIFSDMGVLLGTAKLWNAKILSFINKKTEYRQLPLIKWRPFDTTFTSFFDTSIGIEAFLGNLPEGKAHSRPIDNSLLPDVSISVLNVPSLIRGIDRRLSTEEGAF